MLLRKALVSVIRVISAMKLSLLLVWLCFNHIQSEKIVSCAIDSQVICKVNKTSVIDAEGFQIESKSQMSLLDFQKNLNISYLPVGVKKVFPHLASIDASSCRIRKISIKNFRGLSKLAILLLSYNLIEEVSAGTFKDSTKLEILSLNYNRIKTISKDALVGLPQAVKIHLFQNRCMSESLRTLASANIVISLFCSSKSVNESAVEEDSTPESSNKVSCEEISFRMIDQVLWHETCMLNGVTIINAADFQISSESSNVTAIFLQGNDEIFFLPIGLHRIFPALYEIAAEVCSIKKISKENFHGLQELKHIRLQGNFIEHIDGATFKNLPALRFINLSKKFKFAVSVCCVISDCKDFSFDYNS